jgi:predicted Rdx family selenoprotein
MPAASGTKPQRVSVTLKDLKDNTLVVRTERQTDGSFKTIVIHVVGDERKRGMSQLHESFADAKGRVTDLIDQARRAGWSERKKSRVKPDDFDAIPRVK